MLPTELLLAERQHDQHRQPHGFLSAVCDGHLYDMAGYNGPVSIGG